MAFWEKAENEHHPGDMISPDHLAEQYLQRYRERMDIDDVLRAERAGYQSMAAQPRGNLAAEMELASINLTLHRFYRAIAMTRQIEREDPGDPMIYPSDASLDMEVGDYARAERMLDAVRSKVAATLGASSSRAIWNSPGIWLKRARCWPAHPLIRIRTSMRPHNNARGISSVRARWRSRPATTIRRSPTSVKP